MNTKPLLVLALAALAGGIALAAAPLADTIPDAPALLTARGEADAPDAPDAKTGLFRLRIDNKGDAFPARIEIVERATGSTRFEVIQVPARATHVIELQGKPGVYTGTLQGLLVTGGSTGDTRDCATGAMEATIETTVTLLSQSVKVEGKRCVNAS